MIACLDLGFYFSDGLTGPDWQSTETRLIDRPGSDRADRAVVQALSRASVPAGHLLVGTSGSTAAHDGPHRFVALSTDAFLASASAVNAHLDATHADIWAHALPTFHVGGLGILARAWLSGSRVVATIDGRWDAERYQERVQAERATLSALVPSQVYDLVKAGLTAPPSVRAIIIGGARLDPSLYESARGLGWPCLPSYGMTETCSQVATASPQSMAAAFPVALPVLSHATVRVGSDQRIHVRATSLLTCCVSVDPQSGRARVEDPTKDGWFATEDLGRMHDAGLEVLGRAADSVKVLGELVDLVAVEAAVSAWVAREATWNAQIADLAVAAVPDPRLGSALVLAVVPASGVPASALRVDRLHEAITAVVRGVQRPAEVRVVASIPRTPLGKVQRVRLTELVR